VKKNSGKKNSEKSEKMGLAWVELKKK